MRTAEHKFVMLCIFKTLKIIHAEDILLKDNNNGIDTSSFMTILIFFFYI